jgi:N6-adenosine-specific RNA methylase IME4
MIPLPNKEYDVIYADPPWRYNDVLKLQNEGAANHYNTMNIQDICNLPINKISKKDSILFMWVTMPMLEDGMKVIKAWGFKYKTCGFCWIKTNPKSGTVFKGIGRWVMGNAELCLIATKGKPQRVTKDIPQVILSPRAKHSQKPHEARKRIEKLMGNVKRIELFAREKYFGWDCWGDEAPEKVTIIDIVNNYVQLKLK